MPSWMIHASVTITFSRLVCLELFKVLIALPSVYN